MDSMFNSLAGEYDLIIDAGPRITRELPALERLLDLQPGSRLLDLGCATGSHSLALARRRCQVTAIDVNPAMIEEAQRRDTKSIAAFHAISLSRAADLWPRSFDAIICLGNTYPQIVHAEMENTDGRHEYAANPDSVTASQVRRLLKPGGRFIGQMINPEWVAAASARCLVVRDIPPAAGIGRRLFIRIFRVTGGGLELTITRLEETIPAQWSRQVMVERMARIDAGALRRQLTEAGFTDPELWSGYLKEPFLPDASGALVWRCSAGA
ncbi:class I SAM-dependent methyltransferase [bacterium]|nr:class I SAM-dependent methyltransferase [candidate division CSSED10-310 bacterium]